MAGALVTGSATGIGRAVLLGLADAGHDVVVHYRNSEGKAREVADLARGAGVEAHLLQADVTVPEEARQLVLAANDLTGGLRVLVNNVGNYHHGALDELDIETWHEMFDSNLHATFYTCRTAVPFMRRHGGGRIINLGYAGAEHLIARPAVAPYVIAKTGVIQYSRALARSEAANGITVNVISPGIMENSVTKPQREIPMGRLGRLEEIVAAACFLASDEADYITGTTIEVAGGWNL
ncbi:MAG TPA: bifunctional dihydropteridine reductase/dihydrofolate reductase TmpR [Trueperaceae bacterium]